MGNQSSSFPEAMQKLTSVDDLNLDIDNFNQKLQKEDAVDELGFTLQFESISENKIAQMFQNIFFQSTLSKMQILSNIAIGSTVYTFKLRIVELYRLAELLDRYIEDAKANHLNKKLEANYNSDNQTNARNSGTTNPDDESICPLCLDKRINILLPCMHGYCDSCQKEWIQDKQQKSCPMCRFTMEASQSKINRGLVQLEDDASAVNKHVKQEIIQIILSKNKNIPLKI